MKELSIAILISALAFALGYFVSQYILLENKELACETVLTSCEKDVGVEIRSTFNCNVHNQQLLYIEPIYSCPDKKVKSIILSGRYDTTTNVNRLDLNLIAGKIGPQHICFDTVTTEYANDTTHLITLKLKLCDKPKEAALTYSLPINFNKENLRVISSLDGADCQTMACRGGAEDYRNVHEVTPKICNFDVIL